MGDRQHNASQLPGENNPGRCPNKRFFPYGLRFEKERLETFIDWPVAWMKPEDLAKDGFYYLRTKDHCACAFCMGVVVAWKQGDSPREEHERRFSYCPFIQGRPVGNIPLAHSNIILGITPSPYAAPVLTPSTKSYPERPLKKSESTYSKPVWLQMGLSLPSHAGPKRKDFLFIESRAKSFMGWPDGVKQTPKELAEAGFFYCGLSDHVRCFYCENDLWKWEKEDDPWEEHARWYPECNFVRAKKGQEFIERVRREKPQPPYKAGPLLERELDPLMELDIIKAALEMGFPAHEVRTALRRRLELTGLPFFTSKACVEYIEDERHLNLNCSLLMNHLSCISPSSLPSSTGSSPSSSTKAPITPMDLEDTRACNVCMVGKRDTTFLPCNHKIACSNWANTFTQCPICRADVKWTATPDR